MKNINMNFSKQFVNKTFCVRVNEDNKIVTYIGKLTIAFEHTKFGFLDVIWTDCKEFIGAIDNEILVDEHDEFTLIEHESEITALVI